jgi:hypothetical protein
MIIIRRACLAPLSLVSMILQGYSRTLVPPQGLVLSFVVFYAVCKTSWRTADSEVRGGRELASAQGVDAKRPAAFVG